MAAEAALAVADAAQTRALGSQLAAILRAGDLIMLSGDLGAGKTTFTQGIGAGLGVRGKVTSPTYIIARAHPNPGSGPDLVHVDAYRITDLDDLETLDLEAALPESVTVVEWGTGKTEALAADRLEIAITRPHGQTPPANATGVIDLELLDSGERTITFRPYGTRWTGIDFAALARSAEQGSVGSAE